MVCKKCGHFMCENSQYCVNCYQPKYKKQEHTKADKVTALVLSLAFTAFVVYLVVVNMVK